MRLSRLFRAQDGNVADDIPPRRIAFWVLAWAVVLAGVVLYFKYAALLSPLM